MLGEAKKANPSPTISSDVHTETSSVLTFSKASGKNGKNGVCP